MALKSLLVTAAFAALTAPATDLRAQDDHAAHHAGGADAGMSPTAPAAATDAGMPGMARSPGAAAGMGEMMQKMMAPSSGGCAGEDCAAGAGKTPIYPSLMTLPALTPEKRAEIDALASRQLNQGQEELARGSALLTTASKAGDDARMQQAVESMREGLAHLGAGIAARRVLSEGKAPRNLALNWFKREMNLASPVTQPPPRALRGVTPFHLFTMALLILFAFAMVAMYFLKMRRAAALFGRIGPDGGRPPPGSAPPLAGGGGPSPPADGPSASPSGGAPSAGPTTSGPPSSPLSTAAPVTANWQGQLRVGATLWETPSVKTIRLLPPVAAGRMPFTFVPGQFLNVAFAIGGARMIRSYSISSSPTEVDHVDVTVRREPRGAVSRHIVDLFKVGDVVEAQGPVGRFTFTGSESDSIVLMAGGVGITPMMSITRYLTERAWSGAIFFIYGCRAPADFIFKNDLAALEHRNPKLRLVVVMSRGEGTEWKGPRGRITKELLAEAVPQIASRRIHLCGPPPMMDATKALLAEMGVPAASVKTELFGTPRPSAAPATITAKPTAAATGPLVTFSRNAKSARVRAGQTVLELSEELAIGIQYSCRVGTCGVCKVKMTSGEVDMAVEDALEPRDKASGIILACQAKPRTDIAVEA